MFDWQFDQIIAELRAIRELLEWQKAQGDQPTIAEWTEMQRGLITEGLERYRMALQEERTKHEQMYHGKGLVH